MNTFFYILIGLSALSGAWFGFYQLGKKIGEERTITYYCRDVIYPLKLSDIEELINIWKGTEMTKPFAILNPIRWKDFE